MNFNERERDVEKWLLRKLIDRKCLFLKWVCPGNDGVPDRILIMPGGRICFVELKTETGNMTGLQIFWQKRLRDMGCGAITIYGMRGAEELIEVIDILMEKRPA